MVRRSDLQFFTIFYLCKCFKVKNCGSGWRTLVSSVTGLLFRLFRGPKSCNCRYLFFNVWRQGKFMCQILVKSILYFFLRHIWVNHPITESQNHMCSTINWEKALGVSRLKGSFGWSICAMLIFHPEMCNVVFPPRVNQVNKQVFKLFESDGRMGGKTDEG